jgi:hypothetical protein
VATPNPVEIKNATHNSTKYIRSTIPVDDEINKYGIPVTVKINKNTPADKPSLP